MLSIGQSNAVRQSRLTAYGVFSMRAYASIMIERYRADASNQRSEKRRRVKKKKRRSLLMEKHVFTITTCPPAPHPCHHGTSFRNETHTHHHSSQCSDRFNWFMLRRRGGSPAYRRYFQLVSPRPATPRPSPAGQPPAQ